MTVLVTMRDIRAAKMCGPGTRNFFKRHKMNWQEFITNGLPEEDFIATGDAMAMQVVEVARGRQK